MATTLPLALRAILDSAQGLLFAPGSQFSAASLFAALCVSGLFLMLRPRRARRDIPLKVLCRVMLPRRLWRSASGRADIGFLVLNGVLLGLVLGGAIVSASVIAEAVRSALASTLGPAPALSLGPLATHAVFAVGLVLAYEIGYWTYHYLSHRVPVLWEFHKVHHTAESLSPLTNFRVHPVDTLVFANFIAVFTGVMAGLLEYPLSPGAGAAALDGVNPIFLVFLFLLIHLQHSHFWIAATGPLGRVILSPAHHQLHHSDDPRCHDSNYGSCLAVWDWMFGTLVVPEKERPVLTFGAGPQLAANHTLLGTMGQPFINAWRRVRPPVGGAATRKPAGSGP